MAECPGSVQKRSKFATRLKLRRRLRFDETQGPLALDDLGKKIYRALDDVLNTR
jgi:hypothetical protein